EKTADEGVPEIDRLQADREAVEYVDQRLFHADHSVADVRVAHPRSSLPSPLGRGAPKRGAGIGATWRRGPLAGCDRGADRWRVVPMPIPCASPGSDPQRGPSSAP